MNRRREFKRAVFNRDNHSCVHCDKPAQDAHHLMERRLFDDGGYQLDNGVSLCSVCHILAEQTMLSTSELRQAAGIETIVLPSHLYGDYEYDKWGNILLPNGDRIRGGLFYDESVQKILPYSIKDTFTPYVKHPKTYHAPWTQSTTKDDKIHIDMSDFVGRDVIVTLKRDGEQTSIYSDGYYHARSVDSNSHESQSYNRRESRCWYYNLPSGWRVCGENSYAIHTIEYTDLPAFFEVFGIWDERNTCLSWDDTLIYCGVLGIQTVPVLHQGIYDEQTIRAIPLDLMCQEGYVIRLAGSFSYTQFRHATAKFVRPNHVQSTVRNWRRDWRPSMVNSLRK